ncbi:MAG TPA: Fic family protein [Spirochaetota bacterium]|jgi:Fic family protein|nr:MAG: Adenosine monophosphate-protein transferase SoFic [Spirochaetes bacterium ADurb.Bin133]HNZ26207.1 Fic family protein [Spirochaetota bacterium]HPY87088.1 Fic family protein [Spirochaetota bacterium]
MFKKENYKALEKKLEFNPNIYRQILKKIGFIDSFKGEWSVIEKQENRYLKELKKIATIESIGSSTRIEGAILTDDEIKQLLKDVKITKFETRDQQEVVGYYEALSIILDNYDKIPIAENYIKQLHKILLGKSEKDARHRGDYKTSSNAVVAKYPDGTEKTIFKTTEPFLVNKEMSELIEWTNNNFNKDDFHPLIVVALFVYEFLSIHPFQDGNGRLSRLLTTILLMKAGYQFVQYVSFERIVEQRKKEYYEALMDGQKNRYGEAEKIDLWLLFFLDSLETLIKKLQIKYENYSNIGGYLNKRQKDIVDFITNNQPVKLQDILEKLPDYSKNTIKNDLIYLKNENAIEQVGKYKGATYILKK